MRTGLSVIMSILSKENEMVLKHRFHVMRAVIRESVVKWRASMKSISGEMISALELARPCARATDMMAIDSSTLPYLE